MPMANHARKVNTKTVVPFAPHYRPFRPEYQHLFNSYYEAAGTFFPRPQRGMLSRPTVEEVYRYRCHIDTAMQALLDAPPEQHIADIVQRTQLGIEHETQHQARAQSNYTRRGDAGRPIYGGYRPGQFVRSSY